jgi:acyl-CoA thioester hydrolase
MPLTHSRVFRVRHYECDAFGHLNSASYLRYMQEVALDATAAAGYDLAWYQKQGHYWLVRQTDIDYGQPVGYNESVEATTWVVDFGRVRSHRAYEFRRLQTGDLAARAITNWVFVDGSTGRPVPPPEALKAAFFSAGVPEPMPPFSEFPAAPLPPPAIFQIQQPALWRDIDPMQHLNNASYLDYMEEAGMQAAAMYGWPLSRLRSAGVGLVAQRHRLEYRQPALPGDQLQIVTWLSDVEDATFVRYYLVTRVADGALLAQAHSRWAFVELASGSPVTAPPTFLPDLAPNTAPLLLK